MRTREELAWAAGLFEGDGSVTITGWDSPTLFVDQSGDPEVLHRFAEALGLGVVHGPYPGATANRQPRWQFRVSGFEATQAVAAMLWPWLGRVKKLQVRRVLVDRQVPMPDGVCRDCGESRPVTKRTGLCHPCRTASRRRKDRERKRVRAA